ncbi:MAG: V-type ATP synthase subunit D [Candidatus Methanomethylicota archaeon]|uniref:A-type ATP synthase subunit D n=1 Tax=Thermoproteota archaeon TaxID=2056631 RepID=A0A497ESY5_9CREN|nr:MAG: V-type ATP synthase subunit D [Candidatus Verstraetearchaeota archaeon]RLE53072.1 MAG: V-type ATP synthase subunit D [Candidatus Verstraetearchaeota archaeon]
MSMRVLPTKITLIRLRRSLTFLRRAYDLLEEKRDILLLQLEKLLEDAKRARDALNKALLEAYRALDEAYLAIGSKTIESAAIMPTATAEFSLKHRSLMGVPIASVIFTITEAKPSYGFINTSIALDVAVKKFHAALNYAARLAEVENAVFRVVDEIRKTQRRVNALRYVLIPWHENAIKYITSVLEEREREEFVRAKKVKRMIERRKAAS